MPSGGAITKNTYNNKKKKYHYYATLRKCGTQKYLQLIQKLNWNERDLCGRGICLLDGSADFHYYTTAAKWKKTVAFMRRNHRFVKVERVTQKEAPIAV